MEHAGGMVLLGGHASLLVGCHLDAKEQVGMGVAVLGAVEGSPAREQLRARRRGRS